ncbi:unnamed protein product, partial [Allacma fusca]
MKRVKYQAVNNISQRQFRRRVGKEVEILNYKLNQEPPRAELAFPLHINQQEHFENNSEPSAPQRQFSETEQQPEASQVFYQQNQRRVFFESGIGNNTISDTTESDSDDGDEKDISCDIRNWAVNHSINQSALKDLLQILRQDKKFKHLPSDPRTLLNTPQTTCARTIPPGEYVHFGVEKAIQKALGKHQNSFHEIELQL